MDVMGLLVVLLIGLAAALAAAVAYTCLALTHPPRRTFAYAVSRSLPSDPSEVGVSGARGGAETAGAVVPGTASRGAGRAVEFAAWTFKSRGRELPVWDVTGWDPRGPVVIVSHGWSDSRVVALRVLPALLPHSRRIILWDLPGHGEAPGICSLGTGEVDDLLALVEVVRGQAVVEAPVLLFGASLGAGISIVAAAMGGGVAGVIAEAPYRFPIVPARNVMRFSAMPYRGVLPIVMGLLGLRFGHGLAWCREAWSRRFDRAGFAGRLVVPLLVLHGTEDPVCPVDDGRRIAGAAPSGTICEVAGAAHNNLWTDDRFGGICAREVRRFMGTILADLGADRGAVDGVDPGGSRAGCAVES